MDNVGTVSGLMAAIGYILSLAPVSTLRAQIVRMTSTVGSTTYKLLNTTLLWICGFGMWFQAARRAS
jgi:hypothetical protein